MFRKLPRYATVGILPVKGIRSGLFGMDIQALNMETGEFERAMKYLDSIMLGGTDVEFLKERTFNELVERIRNEIRQKER